MFKLQDVKKSFFISIWFMFLTFPIMVIKVNTITNTILWRWSNLFFVGVASFLISLLWNYLLKRKELGKKAEKEPKFRTDSYFRKHILSNRKLSVPLFALIAVVIILLPFVSSLYQNNIMITALLYVMLGLGLNIVVGLGGLLNIGYIAFYAVGAYTYALLNRYVGFDFWIALPLGAAFALIFGILLGVPVLRLRGDYLAIVTLAFAEIVRIVLENWTEFSNGPSGIANIPRPGIFGMAMSLKDVTIFIYFLMIGLTMLTIFVVNRLENSRLGRAWVAMREDEVASQAMGIDTVKAKITSFALGATWAGIAGVMFAAKTTFINPGKFNILESITVLLIVVLGGIGSIIGVIVAAFILILMPEYLREFAVFRMLIYGAILIVMMVFKPEGIFPAKRKAYMLDKKQEAGSEGTVEK